MINPSGTMPFWMLSLAYWLHMLATLAWIGGLTTLALFILPIARHLLTPGDYINLMEKLQRRLNPLAWISLAVLLATGMFQMSASPQYQGLLAINNRWAAAILIKHILFLVMVGVSGYLTWWLMPELRRTVMLQSGKGNQPDMAHLHRREEWIIRLNLLLGILILGLTALARAS
jgi:uncharacterized membrane protein